MEFIDFVKRLRPIIGGGFSTQGFTRKLFEEIITAEGIREIEEISDNTFKSYFNGNTKITRLSRRISQYIEPEQFISFLDDFPEATTQRLCDVFVDVIIDITLHNASEKIAYFFEDILISSATQITKSTPLRSVNDVGESHIEMPEKENAYDYPYSSKDKQLLIEFTSDYDPIMNTIIGDNYYASIMDTTLQQIVDTLYTKWQFKADSFVDPMLKSYVFALLGELNKLTNNLFEDTCEKFFIKDLRIKIRNLYVKIHPESYSSSFPYEAIIDDWNDGEY